MKNRILSTTIAQAFAQIVLLVLFLQPDLAKANDSRFRKLYDYYFPKNSPYVTTQHRRGFDSGLFRPSPPTSWTKRDRQLYRAFWNDPDAFHVFISSRDEDMDWVYQCVLLLIRLGDARFAELLAREDSRTRQAVGVGLDGQIDWTRHNFPKTRALYSYRYARPTKQQLAEKQRVVIAVASRGFRQSEVDRLDTAFKNESRFSGVLIIGTGHAGEPNIISAPKTMSARDLANLKALVRKQLRNNKDVSFENTGE